MRKIITVIAGVVFTVAALFLGTLMLGSGTASAATVPVQDGNTLSGIAAQHGESLSSLEAANPQFGNPNLIYTGQNVTVPGNVREVVGDTGSAPQSQPGSQGTAWAPSSGVSIPGMPQGLANCIWQRESTSGTNPAADGNQFGIIPASGYDVAGDSVAQQEQVAGQIYAQSGGAAWAADGCAGT
jgi:LysM repeat protein